MHDTSCPLASESQRPPGILSRGFKASLTGRVTVSVVSGTRVAKTDAPGSLMQMTKSKKKLKNRGGRFRKCMKNWKRGKRKEILLTSEILSRARKSA